MRTEARIDNTIRNRKRNKYKRIRALMFLFLVFSVTALIFVGRRVSGFDKDSIKEIGDPYAPVPEITAEAAELYCTNLEKPVYQKNASKKIDPYSITKILTCYLAIENLDLDQVETISQYASTQLENGTTINLKEGEKISVKNLLYGAMLESGNDAARALSEAVAGSEKKFAALMNEQAKEWGCKNTHFVNSNGWKNDEHYTTAHDMAIITARSFENAILREIAMTEEYIIPETNMTEARRLSSHTISGQHIDCYVGGKTGAWERDDASLAVAFEKGEISGSVVVLRTLVKRRVSDVNDLISVVQNLTPGYIVAEKGKEICETNVRGGKTTKTMLLAADTLYAYPKDHDRQNIKVKINRNILEAPIKAGKKAGTYTIYVDGKKAQTGNLITSETIEKGWLPSLLYISDRTTALICLFILIWFLLLMLVKRIYIH